ncbi:hypothetical protein FKM82_003726 [Ascaphus truei]
MYCHATSISSCTLICLYNEFLCIVTHVSCSTLFSACTLDFYMHFLVCTIISVYSLDSCVQFHTYSLFHTIICMYTGTLTGICICTLFSACTLDPICSFTYIAHYYVHVHWVSVLTVYVLIELEAEEWYKVLSVECPGARVTDYNLGEPDLLTPGVQNEQTERFSVFLLPSSHLDVYGECKMQITQENLYLWDPHNPRNKLLSWPLCALRRYGSDSSRFTFEAERVCGISEGLYTFQTLEGQQIYERVHKAVLTLAEQHKSLLMEMEKNSRRLNKDAENISYTCPNTSMLPRSAYWHHITSAQTNAESSSSSRECQPEVGVERQ